MPQDESVQQAWQWLVPPVVGDEHGRLIPRKQVTAKTPSRLNPEAQPALNFVEDIDPAPVVDAEDAIDLIDAESSLLLHPEASHSAQLLGKDVAYLLRRSVRRTIGFSIGSQGLEVTAPRWVALGEIESALQTKSSWIVRKLQEAGLRQQQKNNARIFWGEGGTFDYLGQALVLRLTGAKSLLVQTKQTCREVGANGAQSLHLPLVPDAPPAQVKAAVQAWILREARNHFTARMLHYAPVMGVRWNALRLTSASTRWGSANTGGVIRLNWRLMQHDPRIIDYVVVHELAHLHHMNHSPQFWAVVEAILPDWKQLRKILREKALPAWE